MKLGHKNYDIVPNLGGLSINKQNSIDKTNAAFKDFFGDVDHSDIVVCGPGSNDLAYVRTEKKKGFIENLVEGFLKSSGPGYYEHMNSKFNQVLSPEALARVKAQLQKNRL